MQQQTPVERLLAIVRRDPDVEAAAIIDAPIDETEAKVVLELPDGRWIAVNLRVSEGDSAEAVARTVDAQRRRLHMMIESFHEVLRGGDRASQRPSRPPPATSLRGELEAIVQRAQAVDAVVIDAQSPIVWARAKELATTEEVEDPPSAPGLHVVSLASARSERHFEGPQSGEVRVALRAVDTRDGVGHEPDDNEPRRADDPVTIAPSLTDQAVAAVRALDELTTLHRGGTLRRAVRQPSFGWSAHSFASIYLLIVVFDRLFDELPVERTIHQALPSIERLVLALPPFEPPPSTAGAMKMRRPRR